MPNARHHAMPLLIALLLNCSPGKGTAGPGTAPVTGISLAATSGDIVVGSSLQLTPQVQPPNAANTSVTFSSDDATIASVSPTGLVTGMAMGIVKIRAKTVEGGFEAQATITVNPVPSAINGCTLANPIKPAEFQNCPTGAGSFGTWTRDAFGLPAYDYTMNQNSDARAAWSITEPNTTRYDHFIMMGNYRLNFKATNYGYVEVFASNRAPTWINRYHEGQKNLGGGFSYVKEGSASYSTHFKFAPAGSVTRRLFGMGYFQTEQVYNGIKIIHKIYAPFGDHPFLIDDVEVVNLGSTQRTLDHFEFWDVNRHQILIEWIRTGLGAAPSDASRDNFNDNFTQQVTYESTSGGVPYLRAAMGPKAGTTPPARTTPHREDWYPADVFLAELSGTLPSGYYGNQTAFFGSGSLAQPEKVQNPAGNLTLAQGSALYQPAALVMRHNIALAGSQTLKLRFAYGTIPEDKNISMLEAFRTGTAADPLKDTTDAWKSKLVYAAVPQSPLMHREAAWKSYQLQGNTLYSNYYKRRYTPQGSAYLYLHGADGVPRDQALYAASLSYIDPALAKENLKLIMNLTRASDGEITYSFTGYGINEGAGIHEHPSDLDIFFLFAVAEYLSATGDFAFLNETADYYPANASPANHPSWVASKSVLDHVRNALYHLQNTVKKGPHGLIRIHDGDWSDGIVYEDLSPFAISNTIANGESIPNSQMAYYALPILADQLQSTDASLANQMRSYAQVMVPALRNTFGSRWFARAYLRNTINQEYLKGNDQTSDGFNANYIDLESQPWGLLSDLLTPAQRNAVLNEVENRLDNPSPIGPTLREGGQVWPAISQLMTWAYARHRPARAWQSLDKQLAATHALEWPDVWSVIWSGPDGVYASNGLSWASPVTPMTDFPVANLNQESMFLLALLRTSGVESVHDGLLITPRWASGRSDYLIDYPLLKLDVKPNRISGIYRAKNSGSRNLYVAIPDGKTPWARLNGATQAVTVQTGKISLPLVFQNGDNLAFEVGW